MRIKLQSGQSLIELVVGIAISVLFLTGALGIIMVTLKLDFQNKYGQAASELAQEITEQVTSVANADWHNLDRADIIHDGATHYRLVEQITEGKTFFTVQAGDIQPVLNGQTYTEFFTIEDVDREGILDPATLKITSTVRWTDNGDPNETVFTRYLTRNRDRGATQTDWSGGAINPLETIVTSFNNEFTVSTGLDTSGELTLTGLSKTPPVGPYSNIDPADHWAWNDVIGWIDFRASNNVHVSDTEITGWATSGVGPIVMNCKSTPPGYTDVCSGPSQWSVSHDGAGNLSGYAWNDTIGWISFCGDGVNGASWDSVNLTWVCPIGSSYQVTIDQTAGPTEGDFHNFAWNDVIGWISFNCIDTLTGCGIPYKVKLNSGARTEGTLISLIYNTQRDLGSSPNAIVWSGNQPTGTIVEFQIATDCDPFYTVNTAPNCGGYNNWKFMGTGDSTATRYRVEPGVSIKIPHNSVHYNKKYLRYKVFLISDPDRIITPTVNSITINYSL